MSDPFIAGGCLVFALFAALFTGARRKDMRHHAASLAVWAVADAMRMACGPLRAGYARPYEGHALAAWLLTEILPSLAPPAALLFFGAGARSALLAPPIGTVLVWMAYPGLRGPRLLGLIVAYYAAAYSVVIAMTLYDVARDVRDQLDPAKPMGWLVLATCGLASCLLVIVLGQDAWLGVSVTFATGAGALVVIGLRPA